MLYPGNGKPLFEQFIDIIQQKIISGEYKPGQQLPSERDLAELYGLSRVTIRNAINNMVAEGILTRRHRKGTYVANKKIEHSLGQLIGLIEELAQKHMDIEITVLESGIVPVPQSILNKLSIQNDTKVYKVARLVSTGKEPLAIDYGYLPSNIFYLMPEYDPKTGMIYTMLEKRGYKISTADQIIRADSPAPPEAARLGVSPSSPVLVLERTVYVEGGGPITYSKTIYRADRYEYDVTLKRYPVALDAIPE
ncbi:GntR family transcriptional regulator [Breznakiella homolactica]|uniref:GntR family transcriptional regulator n=1 Tax=Breznakiella homolactica TaxID=2798577 RepID=A0A7T7XMF5_9SPIR|nr:GntR family transcriptional regulator [Breznakiella homolactica]QQO08967.1 GntR family transcriptional regulator [Breznakiella homolactica]